MNAALFGLIFHDTFRTSALASCRPCDHGRQPATHGCVLSKVYSALDQRFGSSSTALGIEANVAAGKVVLKGALSDQRMIVETVRLMHAMSGVKAVECRIGHLSFA